MWSLSRNEKVRAYGSYNSSNNVFFGGIKANHHEPCYVPLWSRCKRCNYYEYRDECGKLISVPIGPFYSSPQYLNNVNKLITNTVRISESEYMLNKNASVSTKNIIQNYNRSSKKYNEKPVFKNKIKPTFQDFKIATAQSSQNSDRAFPSRYLINNNFVNVPSHGNSTKTSLTRNRPGSAGPSGMGVDVKHNSYARYLLKKKGLINLRGEKNPPSSLPLNFNKKVTNNKYKKDSVIPNMYLCENCDATMT